ncbi:MAG: thiosulfate oxidation carrier protein SoxY [Alphaproteobacteria bacterium]
MLNRREFVITATGAAALAVLPLGAARASVADTQAAINAFTGGASVSNEGITLDLPEIAENGNTVPLGVDVDSPMSANDYVESVLILADGNPNPAVATFNFTPMAGLAMASTRIRLATTQDIHAVAKMSDGSFRHVSSTVKVTIGGCGG